MITNGGKVSNKELLVKDDEVPAPSGIPSVRSRTTFKQVSKDELLKIMPMAREKADIYLKPLNDAMEQSGIDSASRQAAFLAQIAVESNQLNSVEENLNYSASRLTKVWPTRFPNLKSTKPYAKNPRALANFVYANRMGNGSPDSDDGYRYRGRGLIQITGKWNYRAAGFEKNPDALTKPDIAASTAAKYWQRSGLNTKSEKFLQREEFDAISRAVNGGSHGAAERWDVYTRAKSILIDQ